MEDHESHRRLPPLHLDRYVHAHLPRVFEIRRDGLLYLLQDEPPESFRAQIEEAADMCPMSAISIDG